MMEKILVEEVARTLDAYRQATASTDDAQSSEDYSRLIGITEGVIAAMQSNDLDKLRLGVLAFSRQVSDSLAAQPPEFKPLANKIAEIKKLIT